MESARIILRNNVKLHKIVAFIIDFYVNKHNYYLYSRYHSGGKIEKNEMGGACGAYGGGERCAQSSGGET